MQPMILYSAFFNVDGDIQLAYSDVICTKGAGVVSLWDVVTGHKKHIYSQKHGFQCVTVNHRTETILVAQYSKKPKIHVYSKGDKEFSLSQGVGTLEISKMALSNDGKHLIIVNEIPEYAISVIDMVSRERIRGKNSVVSLKVSETTRLRDIVFHPADSNEFAVLYNNEVIVYRVDSDYETDDEDVRENYRILEQKSVKGEQFNNVFYDSKGNLYVSTSARLYYLSRENQSLNVFYDASESSINAIVLTQRHLIVLYENGLIEWLNKFQEQNVEEKDQTLRPFYKCYSANINPQIKSATYNHDMSRLIVGHRNGLFTIIISEAERGLKEREEDDHDVKGEDGEDEEIQEVSKQLNLEVVLEGPFHTRRVTMIEEFTSSPVAVTAGMDGKIIFWSLDTRSIISSLQFEEEFVAGHLNHHQNLLVLGTSKGNLMLFSVVEEGKVSLVYEANLLDNKPLDRVQFNPVSSLIVATSTDSKAIYFINVSSKSKFNVVGYFQTPLEILNMSWNTSGTPSANSQLFVLMNSLLGSITPPTQAQAGNLNRGDALKLELEFLGRKIDPDQDLIQILASGDIVVSGRDKILRKYKQPEESYSKMDLKARTAPNPPLEELDGHSLQSTCLRSSHKFNTLVSGSRDGTLMIRNGNNLQANIVTIRSQSLKEGGVSSILISNVRNCVIAGGFDGSLLIWAAQNIDFKANNTSKQRVPVTHKPIQSKGSQLESFEEIQEKEYLKSIEAEIIQKKKAQMDKLNALKTELKHMLEENDKHEEIERLPRDEFAIDVATREQILNQGKQVCLKMREESRKLNLKNEILSIKLKEKTWDQMEIQLKGMNGLRANVLVYNYQIRKRTQKELRLVKIVLDLRRNAVKEVKDRKARGGEAVVDTELLKNKCVVNGGYSTVLVLNDYEKVEERKEEKIKKKKDEEEEKPKKEEPPQTDEQWGLLYSVFELFANNAKRNQILMIRNLIFKIKETFNNEFDALLLQRQSSVDIINDKNKRIAEIYQELKKELDLTQCNYNILENPDRILSVKSEEVGFQRYLSREERERLEKERLKEEERLKLLAQDDASQRALTKMMNGTLEEKKQSALEIVVEREKWMDKPLEEMNEDQKMKLKEYEVKKAKAEEEKQRTIKQLDIEIRKLKSEIEDVLEKFDERLLVVFKRKLEYDYRIEEQELYIQKLMESMVSYVEGEEKLKELEVNERVQKEEQERMEERISSLKNYAEEINKIKESKKQALDARRGNELEVRIKNVEKNVFQEFHNSNPKQKRKLRDRWIEAEPELAQKIIKLDPYLAIQSNLLWESKSKQFGTFLQSIKAMQHNYEGNEQTLLNALETRFNLKRQEADLEKKLANIGRFTTELEEQNKELLEKESVIEREIKDTKNYLATSSSNIEVELRLKQGNVELESQKMVPELSEAILLPRSAIESKNHSILQSAGEKIQVMKKIKACKINVTQQQLNLKNKVQQAQQLYNKIKAIQMLKVKKQMQTALVKKDIKMNQNEIKSIQEQIENLHKEADKRAMVFQKKIEKINSDIGSIKKENEQLELQRESLEETVKQRLKIEQMMNNQGSNGDESREKFEQISTNRKLFDTAKRQTEQIELLREELAKLKAKTFANFSNIQR